MSADSHPLMQHQGDLQYSSGLEVVPDTAPECVLPGPGEAAPECLYPGPYDTHHKISASPTEYDPKEESGSTSKAAFQPWWKRKLSIILLAVAVVVIVGLAAGLGVGLSSRNKDKENDGASNHGSSANNGSETGSSAVAPSCAGGLCPQILSMTEHESTLYVFARTTDNQLTAFTHSGVSWNKDFIKIGNPRGTLISQPKAVSWIVHNKIPRLDVFVITDNKPDGEYWSTFYTEAEGWYKWEGQGANAGSPPSFCFLDPYDPYSRLDFWGTRRDNGNISHTWWYQKWDNETVEFVDKGLTRQIGWLFNAGTVWDTLLHIALPFASSSLGVVCNGGSLHDLLWYDKNNGSLLHSTLNDGWEGYRSFDGDFIGDPAVFRWTNMTRWDFFGIQANHELYHLSYNSRTHIYSTLESLGGNISSVPSAVSVEEDVIDLVALGADGRLQHKHYNGSKWSEGWENLDVAVQSAPSMLIYKEHVYITAVANNGSLISLRRPRKPSSSTWKIDLEREDLGGSLSLDFMTYN